ncbi:hypothetical protein psal_cds_150 [Pandoravirus salinus]|uniref:Uncharacterized protein n=1 Tax=Pandoravirus salinus TaxID=1349410 RepID=A0A291ATG1_9VIRU|nr:hypothetical protein psal_cds_150 [Pandoravirus salinus]ATE82124.1 hypothetical protein psal_cds_150 [Pandoravirus salinus]
MWPGARRPARETREHSDRRLRRQRSVRQQRGREKTPSQRNGGTSHGRRAPVRLTAPTTSTAGTARPKKKAWVGAKKGLVGRGKNYSRRPGTNPLSLKNSAAPNPTRETKEKVADRSGKKWGRPRDTSGVPPASTHVETTETKRQQTPSDQTEKAATTTTTTKSDPICLREAPRRRAKRQSTFRCRSMAPLQEISRGCARTCASDPSIKARRMRATDRATRGDPHFVRARLDDHEFVDWGKKKVARQEKRGIKKKECHQKEAKKRPIRKDHASRLVVHNG